MVPLRSGSAVIGSLEVTGRLGDISAFRPADVRLLETLAAHAAVAVENSRLVDRLRFDAYHDALTGLPNRRRVLALLEEAVKVQAPGEVVAVLVFDIDGLRDVNDSIGHDAGDSMVVEVAARLRGARPGRGAGRPRRQRRVRGHAAAAQRRGRAARWPPSCGSRCRSRWRSSRSRSTSTSRSASRSTPITASTPRRVLKRADLAAQTAKQLANPVQLFHPACRPARPTGSGLAAAAAARAGERRDRGLLPAQGRAAGPAGGRRRVPGPLGPPDARHHPAGGVRRGGRAHRPARPADRGRAARGPAPGPGLARGRAPAARSRSTSPPVP